MGGGMAGGGAYGGGGRGAAACGNNGNCFVGQGEDCTACGVGCGGNGSGTMSYVGCGQGQFIQETTYKYVGCGGDFDAVRPRRDFTCLITTCCLLSLLLPLLLWLLSGTTSSELFDCSLGAVNPAVTTVWSPAQQRYCCSTSGVGCATQMPVVPQPTPPRPTPPPRPVGPVDPFNCAVDTPDMW